MSFLKTFLAVLCLMSFAAPFAKAEERLSLMQHYIKLSRAKIADFPRYKIIERGNKTIARDWQGHLDWDIPVEYSKKAGYLRIEDEGTGGGSFLMEAVLWRLEDKSPLISVAATGFDLQYPLTTKVNFYVPSEGIYLDVTHNYWPKIQVHNFMRRKMTIENLSVLEEIGASVYVSLPKKGRSINAYISVNNSLANSICNDGKQAPQTNEPTYYIYCDVLRDKIFSKITFDLDAYGEKFEMGERVKLKQIEWGGFAAGIR